MNEHNKIRILIVDDHTVVRNGLKSFLLAYDEFELVGEAKNGEAAVRLAGELHPDVALMDLLMPGMDGATATRLICEQFPEVRVIALTSFAEQALVQGALQAGATGYLLKDVSAEDLAHAIHTVCAGKPILAPEATQALIDASLQRAAPQPEEPVPGADLTERERQALALLVEGMSNAQIAAQLVVSVSTAKAHVSSILAKLGVATRTEAVSLALKHKIV